MFLTNRATGVIKALISYDMPGDEVHEQFQVDEAAKLRLQLEVQLYTVDHSKYQNITGTVTTQLTLIAHRVWCQLNGVHTSLLDCSRV